VEAPEELKPSDQDGSQAVLSPKRVNPLARLRQLRRQLQRQRQLRLILARQGLQRPPNGVKTNEFRSVVSSVTLGDDEEDVDDKERRAISASNLRRMSHYEGDFRDNEGEKYDEEGFLVKNEGDEEEERPKYRQYRHRNDEHEEEKPEYEEEEEEKEEERPQRHRQEEDNYPNNEEDHYPNYYQGGRVYDRQPWLPLNPDGDRPVFRRQNPPKEVNYLIKKPVEPTNLDIDGGFFEDFPQGYSAEKPIEGVHYEDKSGYESHKPMKEANYEDQAGFEYHHEPIKEVDYEEKAENYRPDVEEPDLKAFLRPKRRFRRPRLNNYRPHFIRQSFRSNNEVIKPQFENLYYGDRQKNRLRRPSPPPNYRNYRPHYRPNYYPTFYSTTPRPIPYEEMKQVEIIRGHQDHHYKQQGQGHQGDYQPHNYQHVRGHQGEEPFKYKQNIRGHHEEDEEEEPYRPKIEDERQTIQFREEEEERKVEEEPTKWRNYPNEEDNEDKDEFKRLQREYFHEKQADNEDNLEESDENEDELAPNSEYREIYEPNEVIRERPVYEYEDEEQLKRNHPFHANDANEETASLDDSDWDNYFAGLSSGIDDDIGGMADNEGRGHQHEVIRT